MFSAARGDFWFIFCFRLDRWLFCLAGRKSLEEVGVPFSKWFDGTLTILGVVSSLIFFS